MFVSLGPQISLAMALRLHTNSDEGFFETARMASKIPKFRERERLGNALGKSRKIPGITYKRTEGPHKDGL